MEHKKIYACFLVFLIVSAVVNARPSQDIDMDLVVRDVEGRESNPGWIRHHLTHAEDAARRVGSRAGAYIRRQLMRAGEAASRVGSGVGGYAVKLTNAVDRICGIIKKIIPIVGAVCTVGQFKFCALENATGGVGIGGGDGFGGNVAYSGTGGVGQTNLEGLDK